MLPVIRGHLAIVAAVGTAAAVVLIIGAREEVFDATFYAVSHTPSVLAGDLLSGDVFDPGLPLDLYMAAGVQWLVGYRVIGEFLRQWLLIVAAVMIATHLALRLSRSRSATLMLMAMAIALLGVTPIYHHSKLFVFPLTIWLGWRYIEVPSAGRGAALGAAAATAFLLRHDYGIYAGVASVVAFVLARGAEPASRTIRRLAFDAGAYATAMLVLVGPWAVMVQANEGLIEYTRARLALSQPAIPYHQALLQNPVRLFMPPSRSPQRGEVSFRWFDTVTEPRRTELERRHGLRLIAGGQTTGVWRYEAADTGDPALIALQPLTYETEGIDWVALRAGHLPSREFMARWHMQMAALVALAMTVSGVVVICRRRGANVDRSGWLMLFSGIVLVVIERGLFREPSYFMVVAPLTAALTTRFLASPAMIVRVVAAALVAASAFGAWVLVRDAPLMNPRQYVTLLPDTMAQLSQSPPRYPEPRFDYVRECSTPVDRVLITGQVPLPVSYFTQRAIAGGQFNWFLGWRSDPEREAQSLALLQRQAVPFALSTSTVVLDDVRRYPRIQAYLAEHYASVEGTNGSILIDTRRTPTGRHEPTGYPCFL